MECTTALAMLRWQSPTDFLLNVGDAEPNSLEAGKIEAQRRVALGLLFRNRVTDVTSMRIRPSLGGFHQWHFQNRHRQFVVAYHGTTTDANLRKIEAEGLRPGSRNAAGIGVYGTNNLEEAMKYCIDPTVSTGSSKYRIVIFFAELGPDPGIGPNLGPDGTPRPIVKGKPHIYGTADRMIGTFHAEDTRVVMTVEFDHFDYQMEYGMWKIHNVASFNTATGEVSLPMRIPYGHSSRRFVEAGQATLKPVFGELRPKVQNDAARSGSLSRDWLAALGRAVITLEAAVWFRTAPMLSGLPSRGAFPAEAEMAESMHRWAQLRAVAETRLHQGEEGIYATMSDVWRWAQMHSPILHSKGFKHGADAAALGAHGQNITLGLIWSVFRGIFDASVVIARSICVSVGGYPEQVVLSEARVTKRAIEFVRGSLPVLFGPNASMADASISGARRTIVGVLGPFAPKVRPLVSTSGGMAPAERNSRLCTAILGLGQRGASTENAIVVSDDDEAGAAAAAPAAPVRPMAPSLPSQGRRGLRMPGTHVRPESALSADSGPPAAAPSPAPADGPADAATERPAKRARAETDEAVQALLGLAGATLHP